MRRTSTVISVNKSSGTALVRAGRGRLALMFVSKDVNPGKIKKGSMIYTIGTGSSKVTR